jgi:hypothetical protein
MWSAFRNCRKLAYWRYVQQLVPRARIPVQRFGATVHAALAAHYLGRGAAGIEIELLKAYPNRASDPEERADYNLAAAMMRAYTTQYPTETFQVVHVERPFRQPIINPTTDAASRSFVIAGKVDAVVRQDGALWLMEHKTASVIDQAYTERLWGDFQSVLYAHAISQEIGEPVAGVLYNVLLKPRLRQAQGETEQEFQERAAALAAKNKSGKSTAKRQLPESDEDFQTRLAEKYAAPDAFVRIPLYISADQVTTLQHELWELTQAYNEARRRSMWYQNTDYCWRYNRPCAYWNLCRSGGSEIVRDNDYEHREPFEELRSEDTETPF